MRMAPCPASLAQLRAAPLLSVESVGLSTLPCMAPPSALSGPGCWWKPGKDGRSGSKARTNHERSANEPGASQERTRRRARQDRERPRARSPQGRARSAHLNGLHARDSSSGARSEPSARARGVEMSDPSAHARGGPRGRHPNGLRARKSSVGPAPYRQRARWPRAPIRTGYTRAIRMRSPPPGARGARRCWTQSAHARGGAAARRHRRPRRRPRNPQGAPPRGPPPGARGDRPGARQGCIIMIMSTTKTHVFPQETALLTGRRPRRTLQGGG